MSGWKKLKEWVISLAVWACVIAMLPAHLWLWMGVFALFVCGALFKRYIKVEFVK